MKNNVIIKRYIMPIIVALLVVMMVCISVYASFGVDKTIAPPIINGKEENIPPVTNTVNVPTLPSDHALKIVDDNIQVPVGRVKVGYTNGNLTTPKHIKTGKDLKDWFLAPNNGDVDAILDNDITFGWGGEISKSSIANPLAKINSGRTLDCAGKTITMDDTGLVDFYAATEIGVLCYKIDGTLMNATVLLPSGKTIRERSNNNSDELKIGLICNQLSSSGVIDNIKIDMHGTFGMWGATTENKEYSNVVVGIVAATSWGVIQGSEVNMNGILTSWADAQSGTLGTWGSNALLGGFVGRGESGSIIKNCVYDNNNAADYNSGGASAVPRVELFNRIDKDSKGAKHGSSAYGAQGAGVIDGFIVKNKNKPIAGYDNFAGEVGSGAVGKLYLVNNDDNFWCANGNKNAFSYTRVPFEFGMNFEWDKSDPNRIVFNKPNMAENMILWEITQTTNSVVDRDYSADDLYRYQIKSAGTKLSMPARTTTHKIEGGELFKMYEGRVGSVSAVEFPNATEKYTGRSYPLKNCVISGRNASGDLEQWNTFDPKVGTDSDPYYSVLYNNKTNAPIMPGPYFTTLRAKDAPLEDTYAFFDAVGRRYVYVDDNFTNQAKLTVSLGTATFNATNKVTNEPYIDNTWTHETIEIKVNIANAPTSIPQDFQPNKIKCTYDTAQDQRDGKKISWGDEADFKYAIRKYQLDDVNDGVKTRFALFRDTQQLTEITENGILPKVDTLSPTLRLDDSSALPNGIRSISAWMDRYSAEGIYADDNLETAQVWFNAQAGLSGLVVEVRSARFTGDSYGAFNGWGALKYQPSDTNGSYFDNNLYAQRLYLPNLTREESQSRYGGEWKLQVRAKNGAERWAVPTVQDGASGITEVSGDTAGERVLEFNIKVDYTNYQIDESKIARTWNGTGSGMDSDSPLGADSCGAEINYPDGRDHFYRNEDMSYTLTAQTQVNNQGYSIANVNGDAVPDEEKLVYNGVYRLPTAAGATPKLNISLRKAIFGAVDNTLLPAKQYGEVLPIFSEAIDWGGALSSPVIAESRFTPTLVKDSESYAGDRLNTKRLPYGEYDVKIVAELGSDLAQKYDVDITDGKYEILQREINVPIIESTLSSSIRNFTDQWVKVNLEEFAKLFVSDGEGLTDAINVLGIYPISGELPNVDDGPKIAECDITIDNDNYKVMNKANVTLAKFKMEGSKYLIETPLDLLDIRGAFLVESFKQVADLDFGARSTAGITGTFSGTYDGNGYAIKNFKLITKASTVATEAYSVGLFSNLSGAVISNLVVENAIIEYLGKANANTNVGILAGTIIGSTLNNIMINGAITVNGANSVTNPSNVGGLTGIVNDSTVTDVMLFGSLNYIDTYIDSKISLGNLGGVAGYGTGAKLTRVSSFMEGGISSAGAVNSLIGGGENNTFDSVDYLNNALVVNGTPLISVQGANKVYAQYLENKSVYGGVTETIDEQSDIRGGKTFIDMVLNVIPENMRKADGSYEVFEVRTFKDLSRMTWRSWANFEIMNDIYCYSGYTIDVDRHVIGNIFNPEGYQIFSDKGALVLGGPLV